MEGKALARIAAVVFVAIALTVTAIEMTRTDPPPRPAPAVRAEQPASADPLRAARLRCQAMGEAATRDPDCLAAWAESRRRFLGQPEGR